MRTATEWFEAYGVSHKHPTNKAIHWICIPVITWSLLALLQVLPFPGPQAVWLHWGTVLAVVAFAFYATLSPTILVGMVMVGTACLALNAWLAAIGAPLVVLAVAAFVLSWIAQFYGHYLEGEKPSFFEDIQFLLIGPAWLLQDLYRRAGIPLMEWRRAQANGPG